MGFSEWIPGYDSDWRNAEVDKEFQEKVWEPYSAWSRRAGKASMRSGRVAEHGAEFLEGLMDYYEVSDNAVDKGAMGSAAAMVALGEDSENLRKVLMDETVTDERKLKYYLDREFEGGGFFSGLTDYF
jgi:hypothetical protein